MATIKPIFLLADSQLLFWRDDEGKHFLDRIRAILDDSGKRDIQASYIGASNGDAPEFYDLFAAAMGEADIRKTRQIPSNPQKEDRRFLDQSDLILLAGGDIRRGWDVFESTGFNRKISERYYDGALILGVSAGAVQLGIKGYDEKDRSLFDVLRLVPFVVDVHDEPSWARLSQIVPKAGEHARGFGIPSGGGAVYHPDYSVEPIRHPLVEVSITEEGVRQALLFPGETADVGETEPPARPNYLEQLQQQGFIDIEGENLDETAAARRAEPSDEEPVN